MKRIPFVKNRVVDYSKEYIMRVRLRPDVKRRLGGWEVSGSVLRYWIFIIRYWIFAITEISNNQHSITNIHRKKLIPVPPFDIGYSTFVIGYFWFSVQRFRVLPFDIGYSSFVIGYSRSPKYPIINIQ